MLSDEINKIHTTVGYTVLLFCCGVLFVWLFVPCSRRLQLEIVVRLSVICFVLHVCFVYFLIVIFALSFAVFPEIHRNASCQKLILLCVHVLHLIITLGGGFGGGGGGGGKRGFVCVCACVCVCVCA